MARQSCRSNLQMVLFADGVSGMFQVFVWQGAAEVGSPTAYVYRGSQLMWVVRGESVAWVEAPPQAGSRAFGVGSPLGSR